MQISQGHLDSAISTPLAWEAGRSWALRSCDGKVWGIEAAAVVMVKNDERRTLRSRIRLARKPLKLSFGVRHPGEGLVAANAHGTET